MKRFCPNREREFLDIYSMPIGSNTTWRLSVSRSNTIFILSVFAMSILPISTDVVVFYSSLLQGIKISVKEI